MGPAMLELYASTPSVKRQMSEKRDSSPQLYNSSSPITGRPMTRTLSMKTELLKGSESDRKLAASQSTGSTHSLGGGYSFKGGFMSRTTGTFSLSSSPSSSASSLPKSSAKPTQSPSSSSASFTKPIKYFRLKYIGNAILDRRYTPPMLTWIISDIRRNSVHRGFKDIELEVTEICLKAMAPGDRVPIFVHSHQLVSKFTPDPSDKASFTYLVRDHPDSQYTMYLFQAADENMVLDLVNTMREATKALNFQNGSNLIQRKTSNLDNILSNSQQFEVMYVGKIKVYQKRAPPSFIDDAVENFRTSEPFKVTFSGRETTDGSSNQLDDSGEPESVNSSLTSTTFNPGSSSEANSSPTIVNQLDMQRPRSISSLTTCKEYKETLDEESPKEEISSSPKSISSEISSSNRPVTITCTSHNDEKDSVFSDEGRDSMDDSLNLSRPASSASNASGCGGIFVSSGSSLHLPSSSLITNTQSLDEQRRASILRDLEVCSKQSQECLSPIPSPISGPEKSVPSETDSQESTPTTGAKMGQPIGWSSPKLDTKNTELSIRAASPTSSLLSAPLPEVIWSPEKGKTNVLSSNTTGNIPVRKLSTEKQVSLPYRTRTSSGGNTDLRRNRQSTKFQNRTMLFLIGRLEICLISPDLQQILFNKTFNYVSHCSQGVKYMDHFGFICREPSFYPSETYVGYVFRCQTDKLVNEIMYTLKQAFHNAHHAYQVNKNKSTMVCETCPMQWFHHLCLDVENLPAEKAQTVILERLDSLPDVDKNEVMSRYEGSQVSSIEEQNEIIMGLLRGLSERKQQKHSHTGKDEKRNSISTLDNLKQKVRKSLSNSFETILKRKGPSSIACNDYNYYSNVSSIAPNTVTSARNPMRTRASTISGSIQSNSPNVQQLNKIKIKELQLQHPSANQNVVTFKRMSLDYEEITPCLKETCKMWEELVKRDPNDCALEYLLKDAIRKGVPRSKRGEIWQFIACYNKANNRISNGCKDVDSIDPEKQYRELLQQLTAQQHAILVDLGRTFPKHPYFAQPLGAGQLSLFNLLKAYSLFDTEVGYCQGLSFVAAVLLLHMDEDQSFEMMKYLLLHLGLRRQYKPDMSALQMQLYQLTRLLFDLHPDIYQHFDAHDIPPTLYAAPWFLTLFASQFPIGFVARLFDIIFLYGIEAIFRLSIVLLVTYREAILSCQSFESIMELLKTEIPSMDAIQMERVFNQVLSRDLSKQLIVYETEYNLLQEEVSTLTSTSGSGGSIGSVGSADIYGSSGNLLLSVSGSSPLKSRVGFQVDEPKAQHTLTTSTSQQQLSTDPSFNMVVEGPKETIEPPPPSPMKSAEKEVASSTPLIDPARLQELENENRTLKSQNMELVDQLHVAQSNVYSLESSIETLKSTIKRLESRVRSVEEERDALFDTLNMLRQRSSASSGTSLLSGGTGTPSVSPLPGENNNP